MGCHIMVQKFCTIITFHKTDNLPVVSRNTLWPGQNGHHFADNIFESPCMIEKYLEIQTSMKFLPEEPAYNKSPLVWVKAWHRTGDGPLPKPM